MNEEKTRHERAWQIADSYRRRRASGEQLRAAEVIDQHPELMPELGRELEKLRVIEQARRSARTGPSSEGASSEASDELRSQTAAFSAEIPDYERLRVIGGGGFGIVWLCRNRHDGQVYAVKMIRNGKEIELEGVREYKKRAEANPYLLPIGHVGKSGDVYYYIMPLADDANRSASLSFPDRYEPLTLQRHLDRHGRLPADEVLTIAEQILKGLDQLHLAGGVHRDVKPANILRLNGTWRLGDPGLMRDSRSLTDDGGTRGFRPPEGVQDRTADLYALGKTLFLILTGAELSCLPAYQSGSLGVPGPEVPIRRLRDVIIRACHTDRGDRFATAKEMLRAIQHVRGPVGRRSRRAWLAGGVVAAAMIATVMLWLPKRVRTKPDDSAKSTSPTSFAAATIVRVTEMVIELSRGEADDFRSLGHIGALTTHSAIVGDSVRVRALLNRPAYCYLIAFNPNGQQQLCYPMDAAAAPEPTETLNFPQGTLYFSLTDGIGLQVLLLVASVDPLPAYGDWQSIHGRAPWRSAEAPRDEVWLFKDGQFERMRPTDRGPLREKIAPPDILSELIDFFRDRPGIDAVQLWAWPVVARESET